MLGIGSLRDWLHRSERMNKRAKDEEKLVSVCFWNRSNDIEIEIRICICIFIQILRVNRYNYSLSNGLPSFNTNCLVHRVVRATLDFLFPKLQTCSNQLS